MLVLCVLSAVLACLYGQNIQSRLLVLACLLALVTLLAVLLPLPAALPGRHGVFYYLIAVSFHIGKTHSYFNFLDAAVIDWFFLRLYFPGAPV